MMLILPLRRQIPLLWKTFRRQLTWTLEAGNKIAYIAQMISIDKLDST